MKVPSRIYSSNSLHADREPTHLLLQLVYMSLTYTCIQPKRGQCLPATSGSGSPGLSRGAASWLSDSRAGGRPRGFGDFLTRRGESSSSEDEVWFPEDGPEGRSSGSYRYNFS